jgi:Putative transposase/Transposase zinc-binding domain
VELADIFRAHGGAYGTDHRLSAVQRRAMRAIVACRTELLGGHVEACDSCGQSRYIYHSCRNRHCPKCQTRAKERWLEARRRDLIATPYFHVVFTLPHQLNALAQGNPRLIYRLLFTAASQTLLEFGANPRRLGGQIGATLILHTWGQTLTQHIHVHALVTGGALTASGHWHPAKRGFLFPVKALSQVFRGKYLAALTAAFERGQIHLAGSTEALTDSRQRQALLNDLATQPWVVYAKSPMAGPAQVLEYLSRYTHRVALSNERLLSMSKHSVRFRYKDYARASRSRVMTLDSHEFIRRFLLHVLPRHFVRIRHYGLLGSRGKRTALAQCRAILDQPSPEPAPTPESIDAFWSRVAAIDLRTCTHCGVGHMVLVQVLAAHHPPARAPPPQGARQTSGPLSHD